MDASEKKFRVKGIQIPWMNSPDLITPTIVKNQVCKLKTNKLSTLIELAPYACRLLKYASAHIISSSLTQVYNLSFVSGKFPTIWKSGGVPALFKKGEFIPNSKFDFR